MTIATPVKVNILIGVGLQYKGSVHYCHGLKHGGCKQHSAGGVESPISGSVGRRKRHTRPDMSF